MNQIYVIDVSAEIVSRITDKILPTAKAWQNCSLDLIYLKYSLKEQYLMLLIMAL
ncbi:MAG: hypothetical protein PHC34_02150 [Candidatus Gastranaerophilales bacterium]|nr:hypothetical protein [Candidatus Gastranaerophilales bacterium]